MSTPKPKTVKEKPVQWLRNPLLDTFAIGSASGRGALRRDLGDSGAAYVSPYIKPAAPVATPDNPLLTGLAVPTGGRTAAAPRRTAVTP